MLPFSATLVILCVVIVSVSAAPSPRYSLELERRKSSPEGSLSLNFALDAQLWPPSNTTNKLPVPRVQLPDNVKVSCRGCFLRGDLTFSAGGVAGLVPSKNFTSSYVNQSSFDFDDTWVGMVAHNVLAHVQLEIDFTPSNTSALTIPVLPVPIPIPIPDFPYMTIVFDAQIIGLINVTKPVTFTYGADIEVPDGTAIIAAIFHPDRTVAPGFNETKVTPLPFTSSSDDFEMELQLSFRTSITLEPLTPLFPVSIGIESDLPKVGVHVFPVENVTATCSPVAAPEANATVTDDDFFTRLTKIEPYVGLSFALDVGNHTFPPVIDLDVTLAEVCLEFDPTSKALVAPGSLRKALPAGGGEHDGRNAVMRGHAVNLRSIYLVSIFVAFATVVLF